MQSIYTESWIHRGTDRRDAAHSGPQEDIAQKPDAESLETDMGFGDPSCRAQSLLIISELRDEV